MRDDCSPWSVVEFRAMGNACRIIASTESLANEGREVVLELEDLWSRFRPSSEVSAVNRLDGEIALVSPATYRLFQLSERARQETDGWFNPLQLTRLEFLGYARSWSFPPDEGELADEPAPAETAAIELYPEIHGVRLPRGARFDPGGIGKGLAADVVAERLVALGARSVQIELGGDVRIAGEPFCDGQWRVSVEGVDGCAECATLHVIEGGGVATSGVHRRAWRRGRRLVHHLIDPTTGWPAETDLVAATVTAASLWYAEVMAKSVVMAGANVGRQLLESRRLAGVFHLRGVGAEAIEIVSNERVA